MQRLQTQFIIKDLAKKMVLLSGPRQVGKTFLAKQIMKQFVRPIYLNYDNLEDRKIIVEQAWLDNTDLIVLDELHKMPQWKNYLKGTYDTKLKHLHILVTGSARLDVFNKVGDSLAGRYFLHRLLPLSPAELFQLNMPIDLDALATKSGFPEPYLMEDMIEVNRWRLQYSNSILSTDVFDIGNIQNIQALRIVFELLRKKVGSPISYQSLAEDANIAPNTVKKYIEILEALYVIFRVSPFSKNIARSLLKEPKIYFFDTGLVDGDEGKRLENLVALYLLKHVYAKIDYHAENYKLHYLKNKEGKEVDFVLAKDGLIERLIEVKNSDSIINSSLYYYCKKYNLPGVQLVKHLRLERKQDNISIVKAIHFLEELFQ